MTKNAPLALTLILLAAPLAASETRTLSHAQPAAELERLVIDGGVGEVNVVASASDELTVTVELEPKRGSFWSSTRRAEREIEQLELQADTRGGTLKLRLKGASHDERDFSENWSVQLPARMAVTLDFGVGDIRVEGLTGRIEIDAGVGDVRILEAAGDVKIDAGVGDIVIEGEWAGYGPVAANCGVGDANVRTPEGREQGRGFIGKDLRVTGPGRARIDVDAGVGDVTIRLR